MIDLKGKTALITGGTRGIGAAASRLFVQAGARVAMIYRSNEQAAAKLEKELNTGDDKPAIAIKADLAQVEGARRAVEEAAEFLGNIDVLVNNHGIWDELRMDDMQLDVLDNLLDINLRSVFLVSAPVIAHMKGRGSGTIINISSTAGQRGEAYHSHYAASKGAVISMTKSWSSELAPFGVTCNCVAPGWVETEMCDGVFSDAEFKESVRKSIPVQRIASAEDIAGPVLFLASPLARHISGEILNVNGGSVLVG